MKITTKRKMYQKRRKKEKAEQRKKDLQAKQTGIMAATSYKHNINNHKTNKSNQRNGPTIKNIHQHHPSNSTIGPITSYSQSLQLWWQTYCSAIEFHTRQQNTWQNDIKDQQLMLLTKYANEYETSSEEEDEGDNMKEPAQLQRNNTNLDDKIMNDDSTEDDVDEEYLKFLEITHKHRKELLLKRAEGNV